MRKRNHDGGPEPDRAAERHDPLEVIRELCQRSMHRDYCRVRAAHRCRLSYTNRLVVRSPGGTYGAVTIRDLVSPEFSTRNSYLAF